MPAGDYTLEVIATGIRFCRDAPGKRMPGVADAERTETVKGLG